MWKIWLSGLVTLLFEQHPTQGQCRTVAHTIALGIDTDRYVGGPLLLLFVMHFFIRVVEIRPNGFNWCQVSAMMKQ